MEALKLQLLLQLLLAVGLNMIKEEFVLSIATALNKNK